MADTDSEGEELLFGAKLSGLAEALGEAAAEDEAEAEAAAAHAATVAAACEAVQGALLMGYAGDALGQALGALRDTSDAAIAALGASLASMVASIAGGRYGEVLRSDAAQSLLAQAAALPGQDAPSSSSGSASGSSSILEVLRQRAVDRVGCAETDGEASLRAVQLVCVGVAALNWFLQANYTGPSLTDADLPPLPLLRDPVAVVAAGTAASAGAEAAPVVAEGKDPAAPVPAAPVPAAPAAATLAAVARDRSPCLPLLAVDGELAYGGSTGPELLLVARVLLAAVADPTYPCWTVPVTAVGDGDDTASAAPPLVMSKAAKAEEASSSSRSMRSGMLSTQAFDARPRRKAALRALLATVRAPQVSGGAAWWSARATVTHQRMLLGGDPTATLWAEADAALRRALRHFAGTSSLSVGGAKVGALTCELWLEHGLAMFHFGKGDSGKQSFEAGRVAAQLEVQMTGAMGKRTKFQQRSVAQMVLKASTTGAPKAEDAPAAAATRAAAVGVDDGPPALDDGAQSAAEASADAAAAPSPLAAAAAEAPDGALAVAKPAVEAQAEDSILLERPELDECGELSDSAQRLPREHLAVLLALCLDVKNSNPSDGLTTEQMRPYVERVLLHHNDWTLYSTALLQRAWLDFESSYARDRATLQIQALVDQHGETLTFTQFSSEAIVASAPAQDRLRCLHVVVYPPRWELKQDLAKRYQGLGVLVSASQLFQELELWDDVVDCYSRMGKKKEALAVVTARLGDPAGKPTPRMLVALGDLCEPPASTAHYQRAWEISGGRFAKAQRSLGREAFSLASKAQAAEAKERAKGTEVSNKPMAERTVDEDRVASLGAESVKQLEAAEAGLAAALAVQPSVTSDWFLLGTVRMRLEKWQGALTAFSTVVAHAPDAGDAWGNVGAIHLKLRRPDLGLAAFTEGLKASRDSWRMWENRLLAGLQVAGAKKQATAGGSLGSGSGASFGDQAAVLDHYHTASDAVYSAGMLLDLHERGAGRGLDVALLAALCSSCLKAEGVDMDRVASTPPLGDERLDGPAFAHRPLARKGLELVERVVASTPMASADPKVWEVLALLNAGFGRGRACRAARLKLVRHLAAVPGWEKRLLDLAALADAAQDLAAALAGPQAQAPPPPPLGTAAAAAAESAPGAASFVAAAPVTAPAAAQEQTLAQEVHTCIMLVRSAKKRAEAFGGVGASGDGAREKLREALATMEALVAVAE